MSERQVETIDIGRGVQYAKVAARSAAFHEDNAECSIETTCEFREGYVLFSATVTTSKGRFTGHSLDKIGGRQKQFEKQETIAVGRALAFAGYLATGDIACAEEMDDLISDAQLNSLKIKFAIAHEDELEGKDRVQKQSAFSCWCKGIFGEDVDYHDRNAWCKDWYDTCWKHLTVTSDDVPFE